MKSPLKYPGGKTYLANKIVALMPPHTTYVEPYAGGLAVLMAKDPEGVSEVVNDADQDLTTFWNVLKRPEQFYAFQRVIEATPFSESEWEEADIDHDRCPSPVEIAVAFFVRCRQSLAGRMDSFTGLTKTRLRRGMNAEVSAWLSAVDGLPAVHERLRRVLVLNRKALDVMWDFDGPEVVQYLDPPYLASTRTAPDVYRHEMTSLDHEKMIAVAHDLKSKVLISGYPNQMYEDALRPPKWRYVDFNLPNNAAGGKTKRRMTERLWMNF